MQRRFYNELLEWKEKYSNTPLMVVGARQIGKTYVINQFCKENFKEYIYVNLLDNPRIIDIFNEKINTDEKIKKFELFINKKITENTIIFFDEIQESESIIASLKYFCESEFGYKIVCAGSLLGVKLKRFSSSFPVGKVFIKYMYPMNFEEFLMAIDYDMAIEEIKKCYANNEKMSEPIHEKLLNYYRLFLCTGGMPQAVLNIIENKLDILSFNFNIVSSIIDAYFADMKKYTSDYYENIKTERIYKNIPNQLAKENKKFQYSKIEKNARRRDYETSMDWLIASKLVTPCYFVERFETPLKAFMKPEHFKIYLSDVGILTNLIEMSYNKIMLDDEFMYKGTLAENYVASELTANNHSLYYWAENQVAEIDFLLDTNEGIIPIEVKADNNVKSKSLNYYINKNNPKFAIRISTKNFGFENGIKSVPLYAVFCI